ncbi:MAG: HAD family phosphatase [Chlamydiia bacterium]|nr:HAD family phosphatase [Chlamydiia bacterium]
MSSDFEWIHDYQLFLFDMDGLLVNTEKLHYQAYKKMLRQRGFDLTWDFPRYCEVAHFESTGIEEQIYSEFPELKESEPRWDNLYAEKKAIYQRLLKDGEVKLMPRVDDLLYALAKAQIKRCVVTHSPKENVEEICRQLPVLKTIPNWVTRAQYRKPKPDPECYQKAIDLYAKPTDSVIGFEDTPRGLKALMGTRARAVLICPAWHPGVEFAKQHSITHFANFDSLSPRKLALERAL